MRIIKITSSLLATLIMLLYCGGCSESPFDLFVPAGKTIEEVRQTEGYHSFFCLDVFDVYVESDTFNSIKIKAGENVVPEIRTFVKDSVLYIINDIKNRWSRRYQRPAIYLTAKNLREIHLKAPANLMSIDTFVCNSLLVWAYADLSEADFTVNAQNFRFLSSYLTSGEFTFKGKCETAILTGFAGTAINASQLKTKNMQAWNFGIGDFSVYVTDYLQARLLNTGNIYYYGNPVNTKFEHTGNGKLISMGT